MLKRTETRQHYKMYKQGKHWLFASITTGILAVGLGSVTAQADDQPATNQPAVTTAAGKMENEESTVTLTPPATTDVAAAVADQDLTSPVASDPAVEQPAINESVNKNGEATPTPTSTSSTTAGATAETVTPLPAPTDTELGATPKIKAVKLVQAELTRLNQADPTIDDWMPNERLQEVVLAALRKQNPGQAWANAQAITQADMLLLTSIYADGRNGMGTYIDGETEYSLEGLQYATNLTSLTLINSFNYAPGAYYGDIVDVSPLKNLQKLTKVDLQHNRIEDATDLANLENVTSMLVNYNHIRDLSPFGKRDYQEYGDSSQVIYLDPIVINDATREGHLKVQCIRRDGTVVQLEWSERVLVPVFFYNTFTYMFHYSAGDAVSDGEGGLYYSNIADQKPGLTTYPNVTVKPLKDYYFLTGKYASANPSGTQDFAVIQPYTIAATAESVTVHYQDEQGQQIAPDTVLPAGVVGEDYSTEPLKITGYTLVKTPDNATGQYGADPIEVTYVYRKDTGTVTPPVVTPTEESTVTVHHQLANGTAIAADQILKGKVGSAYQSQPVQIAGYKLVTTPSNASGVFGDTDTEVTYVYEKVETGGGGDLITDGDGDDNDGDSGTGGQPGEITTTAPAGDTGKPTTLTNGNAGDQGVAATTLPQTDEKQVSSWWGIGGLILVLTGSWWLRRRNSRRE